MVRGVGGHIKRLCRDWMVHNNHVFILDIQPIRRRTSRPVKDRSASLGHHDSFGNRSRNMHQN